MSRVKTANGQHGPQTYEELMGLHSGHEGARILQTAVSLGIFDLVNRQTADDVAATRQMDRRATRVLLNALVGLGLLSTESAGGPYRLGEVARRYLCADSPESIAPYIEFDAHLFRYWDRLVDTVRTGEPRLSDTMLQDDPGATERFIRAMQSIAIARGDIPAIPGRIQEATGRGSFHRVLDVGAGPGTQSVELLRCWPAATVTLFDLPATMAITKKLLAERQAPVNRITLVEGNYHDDALPTGFDLAWISNIIMDHSESENGALARNVFQALAPGGWVVIKDHILDGTGTEPHGAAVAAMGMALYTTGRYYSFDEVRPWYEGAGFTNFSEQPPRHPLNSSLVFARKA